jgi:photosystem II stability/assembly factor-like uncharacterized protein
MHRPAILVPLVFLFFAACRQETDFSYPLQASISVPTRSTDVRGPACQPATTTDVVFQSADGGRTWQDASRGLPAQLKATCILADGETVYLGSENGLYRGSSTSTGPVWARELMFDAEVTSLFRGNGAPYVYGYGELLYQPIPGAGFWTSLRRALQSRILFSILDTGDGTVYAGSAGGIYKSADGGHTWKQISEQANVGHLAAAGGVLIACTSDGLLRSTDGGEHWNWVLQKEHAAIMAHSAGNGFIATVTDIRSQKDAANAGKTDRMLHSADGLTWQYIDAQLPPLRRIYDVEQAGAHLFCSLDTGIYRSADAGQTWEIVFPTNAGDDRVFDLSVSGEVVFAVRVLRRGC